ncbi:MAG: guanylate kinase [Nitrospinales bacterium]
MRQDNLSIIISSPSGAGKTTVCNLLVQKIPKLKFSVSHTTRQPRPNEKDGVDYFFISQEEFQKRIEQGYFLEWAKVYDNFYGTANETVGALKKSGNDLLLDLDVQGAKTLKDSNYSGIFIFLLPPSLKELRNRLKNRGTEDDNIIEQRLEVGRKEIAQYPLYDYVVVNSDVEESVRNIIAIMQAERCRSHRYVPTSKDIENLLNKK